MFWIKNTLMNFLIWRRLSGHFVLELEAYRAAIKSLNTQERVQGEATRWWEGYRKQTLVSACSSFWSNSDSQNSQFKVEGLSAFPSCTEWYVIPLLKLVNAISHVNEPSFNLQILLHQLLILRNAFPLL
jgi:hypothetical protein